MKKRLARILVASFIALLPLFAFMPKAQAVSGNINQQILPIDCIFQIVNDGSNTITYLTPEECGVIIPPPTIAPITPPITIDNALQPTRSFLSLVRSPERSQQVTITADQASRLPFQQVAQLSTSKQVSGNGQQNLSTAVPGIAAVIAIFTISLIILVIVI